MATPETQTENTETAMDSRAFSAFSTNEKLFMTIMVTLASFFSPLFGQIENARLQTVFPEMAVGIAAFIP
ncbi:Major facilitator superfamily domain general substrate transporter [Penicillium soppii]|uniref:Major facilitator superfamily domain general substrate transporter n=1 Tax=Penicillium soppii TaxID=69789 RepID=UPI0025471F3A|nr:Major facilitator superfamily domain general substrate transporter [Penicillium soppii]KAJ5871739.1 Major facilitator superfamily domain general substrate transporter [Penicillium soppii]